VESGRLALVYRLADEVAVARDVGVGVVALLVIRDDLIDIIVSRIEGKPLILSPLK
jgi:hypothetical protein